MELTKYAFAGAAALGSALALYMASRPAPAAPPSPEPRHAGTAPSGGSGALMIIDREGRAPLPCPLKHTDVQADISGFLARVTVTQEFENPTGNKIEAVYTFPLPNKAAVDDMTMLVGDRTIKGKIKKRAEAREIFDNARRQGHTASLLDQERPNIFTQSVTNIGPGMKVKIMISYVETLKYESGTYEFAFPMVVGPRYIPAQVTDAAKITPPVTPPGTRAGHDIALRVNLNAGVPVDKLTTSTHPVNIERPSAAIARVSLKNENEIPNRDFILRYDVAGRKIEDAVLTHRGERGGFFTLILQPPDRPAPSEITPKELVFVVDTSGSMHGFPLDKCKELIKMSLDGLHPRDTFNLITFSGDTEILFPQPVAATPENVRKAQRFLLSRNGGGGTEMMKAIRASLDPSDHQDHVRVVVFLTDGYVGNDMEIIGEVKKHSNARVFSFGIGSSVNRFLLDKMAEEGRGEVEYVGIDNPAEAESAVKRLYSRVRTPLLTDISIDWNGLPVEDVYPKNYADLFAAKPVVIHGRYTGEATGTVRLKGKVAGREVVREIPVTMPAAEPANGVLASLWARTKIEDLMSQDWNGMQHRAPSGDLEAKITQLGIGFGLMTQFTSFVAVEENQVVKGGELTKIEVPVEMPHGVSYEGVFGMRDEERKAKLVNNSAMPLAAPPMPGSSSGGFLGGRMTRTREADTATAVPPVKPVEPKREVESSKDFGAKLDSSLASSAMAGGDDWVAVKIWLDDESRAVIAAMEKLGLSISEKRAGKIVIGKIKASQLRKLAAIEAVLFVTRDPGKP